MRAAASPGRMSGRGAYAEGSNGILLPACRLGEDSATRPESHTVPYPPHVESARGNERKNQKQMFDIKRKSIEWGGRKLTLETGRVARQADGAVLATYGETMVLATAVYAKSAKPGQDFFPLTVNYQEKFYASGKIPGSFPRREGAPSQKETLTSRLIDRPIRPLFVKGFKNEVQVVCTSSPWWPDRPPSSCPARLSWARSAAPASA
jgi:hypothetical protein